MVDPWLKLSQLQPIHVLDEFDGPRLFAVMSDDGQLLLAYMCAENETSGRFLLVPTTERIIEAVERSDLTLRDALTQQAILFRVDQQPDGTLSDPVRVNWDALPPNALPRAGTYLQPHAKVRNQDDVTSLLPHEYAREHPPNSS